MNFDAFTVSLDLIRALRPLVDKIQAHDPALATQIKKAGSSVSLNLAEGRRRVGRDRIHLFRISAGSAGEVKAGLLVSQAWGWLGEEAETANALGFADRVLAMCWRMTQ